MRFFLAMMASLAFFTGCQDNKEYEAQVSNLQSELKAMQTQMLEMQAKGEVETESKNEFDASGIAIVDLQQLLAEYKGYQAASQKYENIVKGYTRELEKMEKDFITKAQTTESEMKVYGEEYIAGAKVELQKMQQDFAAKEQEYTRKSAEINDNMLKGVLTTVNAHAKTYAEENGYQIVWFTGVENAIFYAKDEINITDAYIADLNAAYAAGK